MLKTRSNAVVVRGLILWVVCGAAARPQITLLVQPDSQVSTDFNNGTDPVTPDLLLNDTRLARKASGFQPEGIHVTPWQYSPSVNTWTALISWQAGEPVWVKTGSAFTPYDPDTVSAVVEYGIQSSQVSQKAVGNSSLVYTNIYEDNAWSEGHTYSSPILHHVLVPGLPPGTRYFYRVGNNQDGFSEELSFRVPGAPNSLPLKIGAIGDLGSTLTATQTRDYLLANEPDVVLLAGDLPYADRYCSNGTFNDYHKVFCFGDSDQRRWDAWVRLHQPLFATVPLLTCPGNHEPETLIAQDNITMQAYNARFPQPQDPSAINTSPNYANTFLKPHNTQQWASSATVQPNNSYYSIELQGAHIVSLSNFVPYGPDSVQYNWLVEDLAAVDRSATPWLIVMVHYAPYHTFTYHYKEVEEWRTMYEPLFYDAGVDFVITGHVHSYARTFPMYNYTADPCGPMYLVVGNAGNVEGLPVDPPPFIDVARPDFCQKPELNNPVALPYPLLLPTTVAGEALVTYQGGLYCPLEQPEWEAYRDPSFGHGVLNLVNATHATWELFRNQDGGKVAADSITITKGPGQCRDVSQ